MRPLLSLIAAAAIISPCLAQPPATEKPAAERPAAPAADLPSGESLFEKHVTAVGGIEAIRSQKSMVSKATFNRAGATGTITTYRQAPGKMYKILEILGTVTIETWCDGDRAWVRNSNKGAGRLTGGNLESVKQEASMVGESDYKASFKSLTTTERTTFNDRPAYAVAVVAADDAKRTIYFDAETGLMLGARVPTTDPEKPLILKFSDYKQFGKVRQPAKIIEEAGTERTTITYTQIDVDTNFRMSLDPPDEVKNLK